MIMTDIDREKDSKEKMNRKHIQNENKIPKKLKDSNGSDRNLTQSPIYDNLTQSPIYDNPNERQSIHR